jgi:hypothetical protein
MNKSKSIPLPAACAQAGLGYFAGRDALLRGELRGWQDARGRWQVEPESLKEFVAARSKKIGPPAPDAA